LHDIADGSVYCAPIDAGLNMVRLEIYGQLVLAKNKVRVTARGVRGGQKRQKKRARKYQDESASVNE
jgi:hypothetical protein